MWASCIQNAVVRMSSHRIDVQMPHGFSEEDFMGTHGRQSVAKVDAFVILPEEWNGLLQGACGVVLYPSNLITHHLGRYVTNAVIALKRTDVIYSFLLFFKQTVQGKGE